MTPGKLGVLAFRDFYNSFNGKEDIDLRKKVDVSKIDFGDYIGWMPYDEGDFWIEFNHVLSKLDDGTKFYIIDILFEPRLRYWEEPDY